MKHDFFNSGSASFQSSPHRGLGAFAVVCCSQAGLSLSCGAFDPLEGNTDGGDTDGPQGLPGIHINCCYSLSVFLPGAAAQEGVGCIRPSRRPCVDPNDSEVDTNGDGTIDDQEASVVCKGKVPSPLDFPFSGPGFEPHPDLPGSPPPVGPYDGGVVFALGTNADDDPDAQSCNPDSELHLAPWQYSTVPPTHKGSFAAASGSQSGPKAKVALNGLEVALDVAEEIGFAITDCTQLRTHEVCYLQLHELKLDLEGDLEFGEYTLDMASLDLSVPFQTTTVTFSCVATIAPPAS